MVYVHHAHQAALEWITGTLYHPHAMRESRVENREPVEARFHCFDDMSLLETNPRLEASPVVEDVRLEDHCFSAGKLAVLPV